MPDIGTAAPDFELTGADHRRYRLSEQLGNPIILAFYRGDNTSVCNRQLDQYNKAFLGWRDRGIRLFGISADSPESHFAFGCRLDLAYPLLSDEDKNVARAYDLPTSLVKYSRSTFVLDSEGIIRAELRPRLAGLLTYPSVQDVSEVVDALITPED